MTMDYYAVLGVNEDASGDEIKNSYRKLAKKYHPDRHKGDKKAEAKFKEISEANAVLSDKEKRAEYDTIRKYGGAAGAYGPMGDGSAGAYGPMGGGFGGGQSGGFTHFEQGADGSFHFTGNIEDIIGEMFGGARRGGRPSGGNPFGNVHGRNAAPPYGRDIVSTITISLAEAVKGCKKLIQFGSGKKIRVTIPAGIASGKVIRLNGQGEASQYEGGKNGNLNITVRVMEDKMFTRKGNDIHTFVEIPFTDAILGTKKTVKTLTKSVAVTIPPGTQPGTKLRLKGLGLDVTGGKGDLYVEVRVTMPTKLTSAQKKLLEEWGE